MAGCLWSWGSDVYGRLGLGTEDQHRARPTEVKAFSSVELAAATCGSAHNIVVDTDGQCYSWGKCHFGQLGHGEMDRNELVPRPIEALKGVRITAVAAGDSHAIAITPAGLVYTWGVGFYGCLGHGDESSVAIPKLVDKLRDERIVSASGGAFHTLAVTDDGRLFVWGRDHCGQLGQKPMEMPNYAMGGKGTKLVHLNQKVPVELKIPSSCKMVSACDDHSLVLLDNHNVLSFGANDHGQLGREMVSNDIVHFLINPTHFQNSSSEVEKVVFIEAGWHHSAAITESGLLFTWGEGRHGQLGLGHTRGSRVPFLVNKFPNGKSPTFATVSCGDSFTVAMTTTGELWAFGSPDYGKLGVDSGGCMTSPKQLQAELPGINGLCCGTNHTIAYNLIK